MRRRLLCTLIGLGILGACVPVPAPKPIVPPAPPAPVVRVVGLFVHDAHDAPIAAATCTLDDGTPRIGTPADDNGYIEFRDVSAGLRATQVSCTAADFEPLSAHRDLTTGENEIIDPPVTLTSVHVDPSTIPLEQLAAIRGAMWTERLNTPYGPRPGTDDNILATGFYSVYDAPTQARLLERYKALGYTHAVTGPITGNDCYHGLYPCRRGVPSPAEWDAYLDELQTWWDAGITPVYFAKPDEVFDPGDGQMQALDALYRQPRAQRLLRVVVYTGWEPFGTRYALSNAEWVRWVQHGAEVFPAALRLIHLISDTDAPTGKDDDRVLVGGNATAWRTVAPYLHGWLVQAGGYVSVPGDAPTEAFWANFCGLFQGRGSMRDRFEHGYAGWPAGVSAWGNGRPLLVYAGEYSAFKTFWQNTSAEAARSLGDLAVRCGAAGYLDGGSVEVPRPW